MSNKVKIWIINCCILFVAALECGDPRDFYDWATGGIRNPQYLFADSNFELCRRVRRVVEPDGKVDIYVENLSSHSLIIIHNPTRLRSIIMACQKSRELDWKIKVRKR